MAHRLVPRCAPALVVIAVQSGLAAYDDQVFAAHVVQHLLLMNFAPILYALSAPVTLALQASDRPTQQRLLKVLHHPVVEFVTNPVFVVVVAYGTMIGYFLTPFYNFSLEHPLVHDLTHLHFLVSGCLFWWLVVGRDPSRWRLSYPVKLGILAVGIPVTAVLGVSLTGARDLDRPALPHRGRHPAGGSILWVVGELTTFVAMALIVYQWMRFEEREAVRADRLLDAQTQALGPRRCPGGRRRWRRGSGEAPTGTLAGCKTFTIDVAADGPRDPGAPRRRARVPEQLVRLPPRGRRPGRAPPRAALRHDRVRALGQARPRLHPRPAGRRGPGLRRRRRCVDAGAAHPRPR